MNNDDITPEEEANSTYFTIEEWIAKFGDRDEYDEEGNLVKRAGEGAEWIKVEKNMEQLEKIEEEKELTDLDSLWGDDDN